jgi:histidinol phosphatase-like enzyme (inositol monophosphatase family)
VTSDPSLPPGSSSSGPPVDERLLEQAVEWTRAAGELTLGWFNHPELDVDHKQDGSPVTAADRAAEHLLRELISAAYPDDAIRGEEHADTVGSSGRTWVIDPIDGTRPFSRGVGTYSNLLYLEDEHGPAVGVVNLPALGETVAAGRGLGCFADGVRCGVSDTTDLRGAHLSCTSFDGWSGDRFADCRRAGVEVRTWGDAYGYALVASGRIDAMCDPALAFWDIAPLLVLLPEAGGTITSWTGGPAAEPNVDHPEYAYSAIASNGRLHEQLLRLLGD